VNTTKAAEYIGYCSKNFEDGHVRMI